MKKAKEYLITKGWKTSILAIVMLAFAFLLIWFEKASISETWPLIIAALVLFRVEDDILKKLKGPAIILLLSALIFSCSAEKRLSRLVKKHPYLLQNDTTWIIDSVMTETVRKDTVFQWQSLKDYDTITIEKEKLRIRFIKQLDTIRLEGECIGDTIYIEKPIITQKVKVVEKRKINIFFMTGFIMLFLYLLLLLYRKIK